MICHIFHFSGEAVLPEEYGGTNGTIDEHRYKRYNDEQYCNVNSDMMMLINGSLKRKGNDINVSDVGDEDEVGDDL